MCNSCVNVCVFLDDYSDPCYGTTAYMEAILAHDSFWEQFIITKLKLARTNRVCSISLHKLALLPRKCHKYPHIIDKVEKIFTCMPESSQLLPTKRVFVEIVSLR